MMTPSDKAAWVKTNSEQLEELRRLNGFYSNRCGHYTGRCGTCGSQNLWDDQTAYGCNDCGATYFTG
jgi:hypothetical protein